MFKRIYNWIYKKITWRSKKKKYTEVIRYYREHPDKFCEEYLGMELYDYQKETLIKFNNGSTIKTIPNCGENIRSKRGEEQLDIIRGRRLSDLESEIFHGWQDLYSGISDEVLNDVIKPFMKK